MHQTFATSALIAIFAIGAAPVMAQDSLATMACRAAYEEGYVAGVEAVNDQLATWHVMVQDQVQAQLDTQMEELQRQNDARLTAELRAAQNKTLTTTTARPMPDVTGQLVQPTLKEAAPAIPAQGDLPEGATITISDPQSLPPQLYRDLMAYLSR